MSMVRTAMVLGMVPSAELCLLAILEGWCIATVALALSLRLVDFDNVASGKKESLDSNAAMDKEGLPWECNEEECVLDFCNAGLGTEESNEAELALEEDCFTLVLEEQHLIDFRNGALGTEDLAKAKLVLEGEWVTEAFTTLSSLTSPPELPSSS
jgi:hypothetical protein